MKCRPLLSLFFFFPLAAKCQSAGPLAASNASNGTATGTVAWTSLANTQLSDNADASAGQSLGLFSSATSNYLVLDGFGFNIPGTALITGVQITRMAYVNGLLVGSSAKDNAVYLEKNAVVGGSNHASGTAWPGSVGTQTYGGDGDTWGLVLTPADVNSPDFGVAMSVKLNAGVASLFLSANIDQVAVTIFYTNTSVLPLVMGRFSARALANSVQIDWTADPGPHSIQLVECQHDGGQWTTFDSVATENKEGMQDHEAIDEHPGLHNYYRLEWHSADGLVSFSPTIEADMVSSEADLEVFPNPTREELFIRHNGDLEMISLLNMQGEAIAVTQQETGGGLCRIIHPPLTTGVYILRVREDGIWHSRQVIFDAASAF